MPRPAKSGFTKFSEKDLPNPPSLNTPVKPKNTKSQDKSPKTQNSKSQSTQKNITDFFGQKSDGVKIKRKNSAKFDEIKEKKENIDLDWEPEEKPKKPKKIKKPRKKPKLAAKKENSPDSLLSKEEQSGKKKSSKDRKLRRKIKKVDKKRRKRRNRGIKGNENLLSRLIDDVTLPPKVGIYIC